MTLAESIGPSPVVSIPDNFKGTNTYAATWDAISEVVNVKDRQSVAMLRAVAEQLDALDATQLDRSRLEDILRRLDEITTPDAPVLPSEPSAGALNYTPVALPAIDARRASLPGAPALRQLMDIGPAPNIDEAGQAMSIDEFRDILVRERDDLLTLVRSGFDDFLTRFMPVGAIMDSAFTWLDEALNARSTGIPIHVEAQIFERHRARVDKEATRLINTAVGSWAAKGYVLPPGALAGQVAQIRRDHADQLATSSREVAIYVTDKHIENARFAIEQMLAVRNQALSLASDYMRMLLTTPGEAEMASLSSGVVAGGNGSWPGSSPARGGSTRDSGLDCSGFVRLVFKDTVGMLLPRSAREMSEVGQRVEASELKPGDLVFFNTMQRAFSHVGIYLGDNHFLHSPKPGAEVRVESMQSSYWIKRYNGARRVIDK